jgi:hypothetical protein
MISASPISVGAAFGVRAAAARGGARGFRANPPYEATALAAVGPSGHSDDCSWVPGASLSRNPANSSGVPGCSG